MVYFPQTPSTKFERKLRKKADPNTKVLERINELAKMNTANFRDMMNYVDTLESMIIRLVSKVDILIDIKELKDKVHAL